MRYFTVWLVLLLAVALAACGGASTPAPTPQSSSGYNAQATQPAAIPATSAPQTQVTAPATSEPTQPAATPDIQKIIRPQPDDWKRGPDGAKVTIIEWGDFQ